METALIFILFSGMGEVLKENLCPMPDSVTARLAWHESGNNPYAQRKNSAFYGLYQLHSSYIEKYGCMKQLKALELKNSPQSKQMSCILQVQILAKVCEYIAARYICQGDWAKILAIYGAGYRGYTKNKKKAIRTAQNVLNIKLQK